MSRASEDIEDPHNQTITRRKKKERRKKKRHDPKAMPDRPKACNSKCIKIGK